MWDLDDGMQPETSASPMADNDEGTALDGPVSPESTEDTLIAGLLANLLDEWEEQEAAVEEESEVELRTSSEVSEETAMEELEAIRQRLENAEWIPAEPIEAGPPEVEPLLTCEVEACEMEAPAACEAGVDAPVACEESPCADQVEPEAPAPPRATRRESMLRLMAAMYPEAALNVGLPKSDALPAAAGRSADDGYVVFSLGGERFAIPLKQVLEADRVPAVTPVPFVPDFVRGVANRRGEVLPLIDLRLLLDIEQEAAPLGVQPGEGRMLVVRRNESDAPAALVVDSLGGIAWMRHLRRDLQEGPAGRVTRQLGDLVCAFGEHRESALPVVDLERLFARKDLEELAA
jgi:purine-binding chemotaxis protein CheW